jgi:hypothetical protein
MASLLAAALGTSAVAFADPTPADRETARSMMTDGRSARDKGDLKAALKAFIGADAIMHVPTTGLEVAKTQAALGLLVEARETALRVTRIAEKPGDPPPFKQARDAASALNDDLEARIPSLTVTVKNVPDGVTATVTIDDTPIPAEGVGQARRLDPGHHVVVAKAGGADGKQEIDLAEKDKKQITIDLPEAVAAPPATGGAATSSETPVEAEQPSHKSGGSKALMIGGFGLAGAGLVAGSITGILSMTRTSSIKNSGFCAGSPLACGPEENSDISSAKTMATISTVSFIVAGGGAALGLIGLLTGNSSAAPSSAPEKPPADDSSSTSRIEPWIGVGAAGLRGSF